MTNTVTKADLAGSVATKLGMTKVQVERVLSTLADTIISHVASGDRVFWTGLLVVGKRQRAAKRAMNPKTRNPIDIPATSVPSFKAAKQFKDRVKD